MKKILLFLIIVISLSGCAQNQAQDTSSQESGNQVPTSTALDPDSLADQVDSYVGQGGTPDTQDPSATTDPADVTDGDEAAPSSQSAVTLPAQEDRPVVIAEYVDMDDTVYATANVVVRNQPSTEGDPVMNLKQGESVHRVAFSSEWTKVEMNGYFYYIASKYLSETP